MHAEQRGRQRSYGHYQESLTSLNIAARPTFNMKQVHACFWTGRLFDSAFEASMQRDAAQILFRQYRACLLDVGTSSF